MSNNADGEAQERRIRDMLGLVKFCLETTAKEDASGTSESNIEPMDPNRRAWLQQAINTMTVDVTRQLLENLALIKETLFQLEQDPTINIPLQKTCNAIGVLTDLCEDLDYASDFAKLDGFSIFKPLISCSHEELIVKACELIAALAQNNPLCQNIAMNSRLLERIIDFVSTKDSQKYIKARSYALYAISSIIRSNQEVRTHFETQLEGLSVLLELLNYQEFDQMLESKLQGDSDISKESTLYWWRKLRIRSVFLFRTLCSESVNASKFFYEKQAIKQLSNQLNNLQDPEVREHLLLALKAFLTSLDKDKQIESLKLTADLRHIVEQILVKYSIPDVFCNHYDVTDIKSTCKELLDLIGTLQTAQ